MFNLGLNLLAACIVVSVNGQSTITDDGALHFKSMLPPASANIAHPVIQLNKVIQKIRNAYSVVAAEDLAIELQTAMARARGSPKETCASVMSLLLDGIVIDVFFHKSCVCCTALLQQFAAVPMLPDGPP